MNYFDFITEEEIEYIEKCDNLFCQDTISLNDMKNLKLLDLFAYQQYLKNKQTTDNKGGVSNE